MHKYVYRKTHAEYFKAEPSVIFLNKNKQEKCFDGFFSHFSDDIVKVLIQKLQLRQKKSTKLTKIFIGQKVL